jgi:hypothetical protein
MNECSAHDLSLSFPSFVGLLLLLLSRQSITIPLAFLRKPSEPLCVELLVLYHVCTVHTYAARVYSPTVSSIWILFGWLFLLLLLHM